MNDNYNYTYINYKVICIHAGIGPVHNLRFNPSFDAIIWKKPLSAYVDSYISYQLTVTDLDHDIEIIDTTTNETSYPINSPTFCTHYRGNVTAFSLKYMGDQKTRTARSPGRE